MSTKYLPVSPPSLIAGALGAGLLALLVHSFLSSTTERTEFVQPVTLTAALPPSPDEKKPDEPRPPQTVPDPTPLNDSENEGPGTGPGPPSEGPAMASTGPLGMNEAGEAGGDAFGLAARRGGHELLLTAPPGGGDSSATARFMAFASQVRRHLESQLKLYEDLRQSCYSVQVMVTVGAGGEIDEVKIHRSTGNSTLDAKIREALLNLPPMSATPPAGMPWPVGLKILSRRADCGTAAAPES